MGYNLRFLFLSGLIFSLAHETFTFSSTWPQSHESLSRFCKALQARCFKQPDAQDPLKNVEKEKPRFFKNGRYEGGRYTQFTFDSKALCTALVAGGVARCVFSLANCDKKFETFKSSVLRPGLAKSLLFWIPSIGMYRFVMADKEKYKLMQQIAAMDENKREELVKKLAEGSDLQIVRDDLDDEEQDKKSESPTLLQSSQNLNKPDEDNKQN